LHLQYGNWFGGACKTAVQPVQVLKDRILKQMTFTYTALEDQNQAVFEKYLKFSKKFDLYQLKLPNLYVKVQ